MASVSKLPNGKWRVQWRDSLKHKRSKQFGTRADAKRFAAEVELSPSERREQLVFRDVLIEYRDTVTPKKRGWQKETLRINRFLKLDFADFPISEITTRTIQRFVDEREKEPSPTGGYIAPATIIRDIATLSAVFHWAIKQGWIDKSPIAGVIKPREQEARERIASDDDVEKLLVASGWDGESVPETLTQFTMLAFLFACRTGMRSGEILKLERSWIEGSVIHLPAEATKTATRRNVALSQEAKKLLALAIEFSDSKNPCPFGVLDDKRRDALWRKIRDQAGLGAVVDSKGRRIKEGLNFHDSRATFATWAASPDPKTGVPRLDILALARQTGHRNLKMLQKYYRASAEEIAKRLG